MEYLLGLLFPRESGRGVSSIRLLTETEYEDYQRAYATLSRFFYRRAYVLTRQMFRQFIDAYEKHERRLRAASQGHGPMLQGDILFDINSRLALWLEAFRLFLNHTETDLKRGQGEISKHWRNWAETKARLFDEDVAYRFMYHLRNYLHVAMPVADIKLASWEIEPGVNESELQVLFSRDDLLANKEWHALVEADLRAMPSHFPVMPLAVRLNECIEVLMRTLIGLDLEGAVKAAQVVERLASEAMSAPDATEFGAHPIVISEITQDDASGQLKLTLQQMPTSWLPLVRKALGGEMTIFGVGDTDEDPEAAGP